MANYLDFEKPIEDLIHQIEDAKSIAEKTNVDMGKAIKDLEKKLQQTRIDIFANLSPWQRVQASRHPDRPYSLAYINYITDNTFQELHGDRNVRDDKAIVGGFGKIGGNGQTVMFIGHQKGINLKMRQYRNFGMANPEGYRKALRLMKLAEKFGKPIVTFIDTPGAYPGLEAEERGQGEAIARNIFEMMRLRVPVICVILGEGASGGALGIGVGDRVLMLENTWYSVISPESCSSILFRSWEKKEIAATALKLTPQDMLKNKLIDGIIKEPVGGAHTDPLGAHEIVKQELMRQLAELKKIKADKLVSERIDKFCGMGVFIDEDAPAGKQKAEKKTAKKNSPTKKTTPAKKVSKPAAKKAVAKKPAVKKSAPKKITAKKTAVKGKK
ncbi:MAG TPA: acetyl-CoA carboxylase carboxyl transferase subunit alpha [Flavobacteriales bacterium]|nr:acetyl-CoA carboxylase carboxyl transferase subunit alpha [Flavobacteriales bacterium]